MPYATDALRGRTILVAEDEYLLADFMISTIESAGGAIHGPFPSNAQTLAHLAGAADLPDAAVLNIRLLDGEAYPSADELARRGVPFLFASANDRASLPDRFGRAPLLQKPFAAHQVVQALTALLGDVSR